MKALITSWGNCNLLVSRHKKSKIVWYIMWNYQLGMLIVKTIFKYYCCIIVLTLEIVNFHYIQFWKSLVTLEWIEYTNVRSRKNTELITTATTLVDVIDCPCAVHELLFTCSFSRERLSKLRVEHMKVAGFLVHG